MKAGERAGEKETHASSARSRDKDERGERMDKQRSRGAYVEDESRIESEDSRHDSRARSRDQDKRGERMDKQRSRREYVEDESSSDSDDTYFCQPD